MSGPSIAEELEQVLRAVRDGTRPTRTAGARRGFGSRLAAIELLEVHVFDRLQFMDARAAQAPDVVAARGQAEQLRDQLERRNATFLERLRRRISMGRFTRAGLASAFLRRAERARTDGGYDALDALVAALFARVDGNAPNPSVALAPELVAYQPTPARDVLTLIGRAEIRSNDVFYDLGSGLGHVGLLVSLLTGARTRGVELEPAYVAAAADAARRLNVPNAENLCADAREASFDDASVFFLYTPFRGAVLQQVLERIRGVASLRPIRVCTFGPCTADVARSAWLQPPERGVPGMHEIAVFRSRA